MKEAIRMPTPEYLIRPRYEISTRPVSPSVKVARTGRMDRSAWESVHQRPLLTSISITVSVSLARKPSACLGRASAYLLQDHRYANTVYNLECCKKRENLSDGLRKESFVNFR